MLYAEVRVEDFHIQQAKMTPDLLDFRIGYITC